MSLSCIFHKHLRIHSKKLAAHLPGFLHFGQFFSIRICKVSLLIELLQWFESFVTGPETELILQFLMVQSVLLNFNQIVLQQIVLQ